MHCHFAGNDNIGEHGLWSQFPPALDQFFDVFPLQAVTVEVCFHATQRSVGRGGLGASGHQSDDVKQCDFRSGAREVLPAKGLKDVTREHVDRGGMKLSVSIEETPLSRFLFVCPATPSVTLRSRQIAGRVKVGDPEPFGNSTGVGVRWSIVVRIVFERVRNTVCEV